MPDCTANGLCICDFCIYDVYDRDAQIQKHKDELTLEKKKNKVEILRLKKIIQRLANDLAEIGDINEYTTFSIVQDLAEAYEYEWDDTIK
jgi:hypothetical protein